MKRITQSEILAFLVSIVLKGMPMGNIAHRMSFHWPVNKIPSSSWDVAVAPSLVTDNVQGRKPEMSATFCNPFFVLQVMFLFHQSTYPAQVPILPGNVYAINDALSAEGAADDYETCIKQLVKNNVVSLSTSTGFPKFDLMLLGMGPDGHVASLFPGHPLVNEKERWVTYIKDSPKPPPQRITFTFPVINSSAFIAMVVAGPGEVNAVHMALGSTPSSGVLPVQMVLPEEELAWFLDKQAAWKL